MLNFNLWCYKFSGQPCMVIIGYNNSGINDDNKRACQMTISGKSMQNHEHFLGFQTVQNDSATACVPLLSLQQIVFSLLVAE